MSKTNRNAAGRLKAAEAELARFASFPECNPNPVVEVDAAGHVSYQNPAARTLFPDLAERGLAHAWLAGLPAAAENIGRTGASQIVREVSVAGATYEQSLFAVGKTGLIRIYGRDVTARRHGEHLIRAQLQMFTAVQSGGRSVDDTLRIVLDQIEARTGSAIGFYHFVEADQETLALQGWSTSTLDKMCTAEGKGRHYPVSQAGVWVECVRERRPVVHNDYASLPHRKGLPPGHAPVRRELVVPILRGSRIVAIIGVGNKPTDYTPADIEIVSHLGDSSWEIVERQRAEEEIKRKSAVVDGINSIFRAALGCISEEELGRACLAVAEKLTRSTFGFIGEIGSDGLLHDIATSDPGWQLCTMYDKAGHRRPPGDFRPRGLYGRVILDGRSFFSNDPPSHPDSIGTPAGHPVLESFLGVPLFRAGKVIGMIALGNREGGYGEGELQSVEELAPAVVEALQRVRTELALSRSEERLERAQAIAHLGSWELDLVGQVLSWSDEVYRIFGVEPQEFVASYEAFLAAVHPEDRAAVDAAYSDSVRAGRDSYEIVHRIVQRTTGEIRVVHEKCRHFRDAAGRIVRSVGMVHDITERTRSEAALLKSMQRFELLAQTAGDLLQAPEPQKVVQWLSQRLRDFLHCRLFFNFLVDEETGELRLNAAAGISEAEARRLAAAQLPDAGAACSEWVKSCGITAHACHPLLGPEGQVLGTLCFGAGDRDAFSEDDLSLMKAVVDLVAVAVTRMRGSERLRRTVEELARSNEDLGQFAYVASHDLQEPLRAVTGFLGLLKDRCHGKLDAKADTWIFHAVEGAKRMSGLIDDLLEYSRVDHQDLQRHATSAQTALNGALQNLRSMIAAAGAKITHDTLPTVRADGRQLAQLFQNFIGNAVKFRAEGRPCEIHVSARREGREWVLSVRDNGIGIAEQHFGRIFLIFQRLHPRGQYAGTGIGLAICKRIVERHGGRIWVESRVGAGAAFCFTLPDVAGAAG